MSTPSFGAKILAYFRLMRPANIVTAISDIFAGVSVAGIFSFSDFDYSSSDWQLIFWLVLSTTGLYGGGVVFNDVFDAELDRNERPERPIPSGLASVKGGIIFGTILLALGIFAASQVSILSAGIATAVATLALAYDALLKHHTLFGPLTMGLCRAGNLLLGISIVNEKVSELSFMGIVPLVFVSAITLISRGEVHGGKKSNLFLGTGLFLSVIAALCVYGVLQSYNIFYALPFVLVFALIILPPIFRAVQNPVAKNIRKAVKFGVLSLIPMNASIGAGFAGWESGVLVVLLLPVSLLLAKKFAVT